MYNYYVDLSNLLLYNYIGSYLREHCSYSSFFGANGTSDALSGFNLHSYKLDVQCSEVVVQQFQNGKY